MSLRARLLIGMVVLVSAGLTVAAVVTYEEQRSFLYDRVDSQVGAAIDPISVQLSATHGKGFSLFGRRGFAHRPFTRPPRGGRPASFLPPGTFGELLGAHNLVVGRTVSLSFTTTKPPALPSSFPRSQPDHPRLFTFSASGGARYRALAMAVPDGTVVIAVPLREVDQTLQRLVVVEALVGAGVIIALVALGWLVIRIGLRPLERIGRTASAIAHGDLSRRVSPAEARTEVGRLGVSLNDMLAQIEQAFADRTESEERLRQFLADASHELRTPLAAVRGYAEAVKLGDPEAIERSMARIEAEAARMSGLVEDLLMLARLDELPEAEHVGVDLVQLAEHAAADARAIAPDRELRLSADGTHLVEADPDQLRQVLSNLLRNAMIHTPPGSPIELRVGSSGEETIVEVRDHGPGLPADAGERVFERFWRSEGGRSRGRGGAGLGLAIVKAIVLAHHGRVEAENAPDGGAVFRVTLPAASAARRLSANAQQTPSLVINGSGNLRR